MSNPFLINNAIAAPAGRSSMPAAPADAAGKAAAASQSVAAAAVGPAPESAPAKAEPSPEARRLQAQLDEMTRSAVSLRFQVAEDVNRIIVQMVDRESGEVIRQVPGEDALKMAREIAERAAILSGKQNR